MAKEDNKKFYFTPLRSEDRILALKDLAGRKEIITVWKKGDERISERFEIKALDEKEGAFILESKESSFLDKITKKDEPFAQNGELVLFKSPLNRYQYFSSGRMWFEQNDGNYYLKIDHDTYRAEQRQDFRLDSNEYNTIQFTVDTRIYLAIDASAGGVCIGIMPQEKGLFAKDTVFFTCFLSINGTRFKIPEGKVVKIWEAEILGPDKKMIKGYKVGIQFLKVEEKEKEEICRHVITEARKEDQARRSK